MEQLAVWLEAADHDEEAQRWHDKSATMWVPDSPAPVKFRNAVEFLGLSLSTNRVRQGESLKVSYYWRCPPKVDIGLLAVFVHVCGPGESLFQDDHVLLENMDIAPQPFPEVFVEHRTVAVPADMPAGNYEIRLGLYSRLPGGERVKPSTKLRARKRAVYLPVGVRVGGGPL
jgi:hypothetical protein